MSFETTNFEKILAALYRGEKIWKSCWYYGAYLHLVNGRLMDGCGEEIKVEGSIEETLRKRATRNSNRIDEGWYIYRGPDYAESVARHIAREFNLGEEKIDRCAEIVRFLSRPSP